MKIKTTRFGEIEVLDPQIYTFPEGILGFPELHSYAIYVHKPGPFQWLQSTELPSLAFVVTAPALFFPDYVVDIRPEDLTALQLPDVTGGTVLVTLTISKGASEITANLLGPLVFNGKAKLGRQVVLSDSRYTTKHKLLQG